MNETRAPTSEAIKEKIRLDYVNGMKPKALSEKYGISIDTIKSWIKRKKWGQPEVKESAPHKKEGAPLKKKTGAPYGNKNAEGAGAPQRNKNAEKHGAYTRIYWDVLDEDEQQLMQDLPTGEEYQLQQQITMYTVRERRLLHHIEDFKNSSKKGLYVKGVKKKKRIVYDEDGKGSDAYEDTNTDTEYAIKALMALEAELTKVQRAKTRCIDSLIHLRAVNERYDDLLNGWKSKAEATTMEEDAEEEDIVFYLPKNGREEL